VVIYYTDVPGEEDCLARGFIGQIGAQPDFGTAVVQGNFQNYE